MRNRSKGYLEKTIRRKTGRAIDDYRMIGEGDRVLVAVSGGKDSIVLMNVLALLRAAAPVHYDLVPIHVRSGFETGFEHVQAWIEEELGYNVVIVEHPIREILETVGDPDKSPCALCSRLRRGRLYHLAREEG
ncbi:MAG TPA: ATP-binding protein, partial [Deltaproteobacteria bacterium]|nr:ATP-binding protein [Deltaproteobacteria bacterium]